MISIFEMRALLQTTKEEQPVRAGSVSDGPQPAQTGSISDGPEPAQTGSVSEGPQPAQTGSVSEGPLQAVAHASGSDRPGYGLLAEFDNPATLVTATQRVHEAGYRKVEAYSPFPVEGLAHALGFNKTGLPLLVLFAGIGGGLVGYLLQYYTAAIDYPINVGGRPFNSWPAFMPVTFELTILFAALGAVLGMLALNGLPRPHHPLFNVERFALSSRDRFFLCVQTIDPHFDAAVTRQLLESLGPKVVVEVEQ